MKKTIKLGIVALFMVAMLSFAIATTTNIRIDKTIVVNDKLAQRSLDKGSTITDDIVERGVEELEEELLIELKQNCVNEIRRLEGNGDIEGLEKALAQLKKIGVKGQETGLIR